MSDSFKIDSVRPTTGPTQSGLDWAELRQRAGNVKLVLADNDGTLTDGCVYVSAEGEALKKYSHRDGMGFELLRNAGLRCGIVTREDSPIVLRRAEKLKLEEIHIGIRDKGRWFEDTLVRLSIEPHQVAFIGDDINDLPMMERIAPLGLTGCPADAHARVRIASHFVASRPGGAGAFREFAEWLLELKTLANG